MTQTLDGILKTKFLTNSSIPASRAFTQTIAQLLPQNATLSDAINLAQSLYLQATGSANVLPKYAIEISKVPSDIKGFSDPYARQSVSDFAYLIREVIQDNPEALAQYESFRPNAILHEAFKTYLPEVKKDYIASKVAA